MPTISESYRDLYKELHSLDDTYGGTGYRWVPSIISLARSMQTQDILDYGCGKSTIAHNIPFKIKQYDPAIDKFSERPASADLLVSTDVLEHVEPARINDVLQDMADLTKKKAFLVIATRPAIAQLSDFRNAHVLIRSPEWWVNKLCKFFDLENLTTQKGAIIVLVKSKYFREEEPGLNVINIGEQYVYQTETKKEKVTTAKKTS